MAQVLVGVVGVGNMGWPMAACLLKKGFAVQVYDARPEAAKAFAAEVGGTPAPSLKELAQACSIIITMLPDSKIVGNVLFEGADNLSAGMAKGTTLIEMSSGLPSATIDFARRLKEKGITLIDAPVSGGVPRAVTGELAIMVGGDTATIEKVRPVLAAMGTTITPTGGVGAGHAMKALNNLVSAGGFLAGVEALLIGARFGLDVQMMVDVLNASTGMNNSTQKKFKQFVLSGAYNAGFGLDLMVKDLSIAMALAQDGKVAAPFSASCREMWAAAAGLLGPGRDHTEMARFSEQVSGFRFDQLAANENNKTA